MKKKTLFALLLALVSVATFAQKELVTPPSTATVETWYTTDGTLNVNLPGGGVQQLTPAVKVAIDATDIYIQGMAYFFPEAWVKGTISGTTATFPSGQFLGEDEYGAEYFVGAQGQDQIVDVVFDYNATEGVLKATTPYILENAYADQTYPYCYWLLPTFSKTAPKGPQPVVAPEGLTTDEWAINATTNFKDPVSGYLKIGFDGTDVYLQGLCTYLPETWIKGTLEGNKITFPGDQYFGPYTADPYTHYEFYLRSEGIEFDYDAAAGKMTASGEIYIREAIRNYKGDVYNDPVVTKVIEKAGTPAKPNISGIYDGVEAPMLQFSVATVDVDGNAMASSKLKYQILKDVEKEISTVVFDPADYSVLEETMTEFPYTYSNGDDFHQKRLNLRQSDFKKWNNVGIQAIYTGGGEEHKSEICWYHLKDYQTVTFDFNAMTDEPCSTSDSNEGDITTDRVFKSGEVTMTVSPSTSTTPNRFWNTNNGPQLRVYGGTVTFEAAVGKVISKIVFNNGKWNAGNTADTGSFEGNVWKGDAQKVVVTIAGNTQLNSIEVLPADYVPTPVVAPENLAFDTYVLNATAVKPYYDPANLTLWLKGGFDGDDLYIQGLASDYNSSTADLWVKATKNAEGKYVIPANQFMGSVKFWQSYIDCFFTALDADGKMTDVVFNYDAEKRQLTTDQTLVLNGKLTEVNAYETFTGVVITKFDDVAATPAAPKMNNIDFNEWSHSINFSVPTVDVDGNTLNPKKLFYIIWITKNGEQTPYVFDAQTYYTNEDVTEQPWNSYYDSWSNNHSIYLYDDVTVFPEWQKVGVQSVYYGGNERRATDINWIDNPTFDATGIDELPAADKTPVRVIFNLSGQRIAAPQKGLNIINGKKVVVK